MSVPRARVLAIITAAAALIVGVSVMPSALAGTAPLVDVPPGCEIQATVTPAPAPTPTSTLTSCPGAVSGQLTDAGTPVGGAKVELILAVYPFLTIASTTTAADGSFRLDNVRVGAYKLKFSLLGGLTQFFHGATSLDAGSVIVVTERTEVVVAESLVPHGEVTGHVTTSTGASAGGASVSLYVSGGFVPIATVTADATGSYLFPYVFADSYNLQVARAATSAPKQWVHQHKDQADADAIAVAVGAPTVVDEQLLPLGVISGSYRNAGGPVSGVVVYAFSQATSAEDVVANTASDGTFSLYAYPGQYKLKFTPTPGLNQWAHGKETERDADVVSLAANATVVDAETALPTGHAQGHLVDADGQPVAFASVELQDPARDRFFDATTDADGAWSVLAFSGTYKVQFGLENQVQWAHGQLTQAAGAPVTVGTDQTTTVDETMLRPGSLSVTAVDAKTGAAITDFCAIAENGTVFASACASNGTAVFDPLGPGTYNVTSSDGVHLDGTTSGVRVASGQSASALTKLLTGATIVLNLVDSRTGVPVDNACANTVTVDHPFVPGNGNGGCTDGGVITMDRVPPDRYQLFVSTFDGVHGAQWVGPAGGVGIQAQAKVLTAKPGATIRLTVKVDGSGSIAGVITDKVTGAPIAGATVSTWVQAAVSDTDGSYQVDGLGPYQWTLLFGQTDYASQWSGGGNNRLNATPVRVREGRTTTYNVALRKGTTLTGRVLAPTGERPDWGVITVFNATTFDDMGQVRLAPDGTYTVHVLGPQVVDLQVEASLHGIYQLGWYNQAADFAHATPVVIPPTGTKILNITTR